MTPPHPALFAPLCPAVGGAEEARTRKERVRQFKELTSRMEAALRPITEQLERLKDLDPPDYGSLQVGCLLLYLLS